VDESSEQTRVDFEGPARKGVDDSFSKARFEHSFNGTWPNVNWLQNESRTEVNVISGLEISSGIQMLAGKSSWGRGFCCVACVRSRYF
jgi:hypothetical protein